MKRLACLALILLPLLPVRAADLSGSYVWKPMKIGGGGWIVGMHLSPTEKNLAYIRTDVSGAYRWNPDTSSWKQLVTSASMPADWVGYGRYAGVDSIVSAPNDPDVAYMAFNGKPWGGGPGQVFRSVNRGDTWTATRFLECHVKMEPNGEGRQSGERLAVDPANRDVVYFASIADGLWATENGGVSWTKAAAIPQGQAPQGVNTVVFDQDGGVAQGKTRVIYVTVEAGGVFRSADAGTTWQKISDGAAGDGGRPRDAALGPDGTYYVAYEGGGGIWKYSRTGTWSDITPKNPEGGSDKPYWAVAADPANPQHIVAMIHGGKTFDSSDQGAAWTYHLFKLKSSDIAWQDRQTNYFLSTGELLFDPFDAGKLWYAEGFGVWQTRDLSPSQIEWTSVSRGIEEACGNDVVAPPGGKPVGAMWDLGVFHFGNVDAYDARRSQPNFMSAWSLDWCAQAPKFLVAVFQNHLNFPTHANSSGFSTDGGETWTRFPAIENETAPQELKYGVIAVSSQNPDHILWAPTDKKLPYYTADRGATWKPASLAEGSIAETGLASYPTGQKPLCADRVEPDTFYLYTPREGILRSTDGGVTFTKAGMPEPNKWNAILKAAPGRAKELWFAGNDGGGLRHSSDGGTTWTKIQSVQAANNIGLGKARTGDGYPALYLAGIVAGQTGLHRSLDQGATWEKIGDYPLGIFDSIKAIDGDKDLFGVVYLAFGGSGFAYGQPSR